MTSTLPSILIVDDVEDNLFVFQSILSGLEARLLLANSAQQALTMLLDEAQMPAIALLDVQMPDMDGYELATMLRSVQRTREIPIIFVSAVHRDDAHIGHGYDVGAVDFLVKPVNEQLLRRKIKVFIELQQYREQAAMQAAKQARDAERKFYLQQLAEREQSARSLVDSGKALVWTASRDKLRDYFNENWLKFTGRNLAQELGNGWVEGVHPDDLECYLKEYTRCFDQREAFSLEYRLRHADGEYRWIADYGSQRCDATGNFIGYIGLCYDINERKQAELLLLNYQNQLEQMLEARTRDLMVSEARLRELFELSPIGIALNDYETGAFLELNQALYAPTGYSREEFMQLTYWDITPEKYAADEQKQLQSMALTGRYGPYEKEYRRKDGSLYPVLLNGMQVFDRDGRKLIWSIVEDISKRKYAERVQLEQMQHIQAIFDNMVDGLITIDEHGLMLSFNPAAEHIFGYRSADVLGRNVAMLMPSPHREQHDSYLRNYQNGGQRKIIGIGREVDGQRADGSLFAMELAVSEISRNDRPIYIGMVRDITERKRLDKLKSEFVSTVSHELRTPLTAIIGTLGLMVGGAMGALPPLAKQMAEMAHRNSQRLSALINDLLDMEKLAAGKMDLDLQTLPLLPLVNQCLQDNHAYAERYGVSYQLVNQLPDLASVRVDSLRFQQVLTNLLSNAAKFSPTESVVEVTLSLQPQYIRICVQDHGPGIPAEFQARIFQKFAQADSSDTRQKGGTGLGLAISKELVERMGGQIGFASVAGRGACFWVDMPS